MSTELFPVPSQQENKAPVDSERASEREAWLRASHARNKELRELSERLDKLSRRNVAEIAIGLLTHPHERAEIEKRITHLQAEEAQDSIAHQG